MYWAIYDQAQDKKMTLAVWDLDATVGSNWSTNPLHPDYVKPDNNLAIMNFISITDSYHLMLMDLRKK